MQGPTFALRGFVGRELASRLRHKIEGLQIMRKIGVVLASVALAVGALSFSSYVAGPAGSMRKAKAQAAPAQPNIVFILLTTQAVS